MKPYPEACEDQIEEILDEFDFGKVHKVMTHLGWTWHGEGIPTIGDLRIKARTLLWEVAEKHGNTDSSYYYTKTAGFRVSSYKGIDKKDHWVMLRLAFEVTDWESDDENKLAYKP